VLLEGWSAGYSIGLAIYDRPANPVKIKSEIEKV